MDLGDVRRWAACATAVSLLALSGCSSDQPTPPDPSATSAQPTTVDAEQAIRDECASSIPDDATIRPLTLDGATDGQLQALEFPSSGTRAALVLLPQVEGGVCGWGRFAAAAAELGFASIVVAPCGYGESTCTKQGDADPLNEVAPAIERLRADFDTERVVLLGASMGGSLTVLAAAGGADVDTWIDVSGPSSWEKVDLLDRASALPAGGLVVQARSDGAAAYTAAKLLARRSGARFLDGGAGHGYELLTNYNGSRISRVGRIVLVHAKG